MNKMPFAVDHVHPVDEVLAPQARKRRPRAAWLHGSRLGALTKPFHPPRARDRLPTVCEQPVVRRMLTARAVSAAGLLGAVDAPGARRNDRGPGDDIRGPFLGRFHPPCGARLFIARELIGLPTLCARGHGSERYHITCHPLPVNEGIEHLKQAIRLFRSLKPVWMLANVAESDSPAFKVGQAVKVSVLAFPNRIFEGHITTVSSSVDPTTRRMLVRSEIADPTHELRAGMFANFVISTGAPERSLAIPLDGVVREGDGTMTVWVTADRRRYTKRIVETGLQRDGYMQILKGIQVGELVVIEGALYLSKTLSISAP
jgi:Barrel-sandwich domain of CusB or HlyD membrane-fusion